MSAFREQNGLFWWVWLTPCSLQREIRWVFTATWWNDCIFSVRGPQGDSERHVHEHLFSPCLTTFLWVSCTHITHTHNLCMWLCEHVHIRGEVYLLNHPVDIAHCVCGVKLWPSSHWRVCLWASLCPLSFTELKPLRTDSLAWGFCLLETSAVITEDRFLFITFLCLPYMTITFQDTCILSHLHIISAFSLSFP